MFRGGREVSEMSVEIKNSSFEKKLDPAEREKVLQKLFRDMDRREADAWSKDVMEVIRSEEESDIYTNIPLKEEVIGDKLCLTRSDIDMEQKDEKGMTNRERMENGRPPLDQNGNPIELHHVGQHTDSPLAELTHEEHRSGGNDTILHDKTIETEAHAPGNTWSQERQAYWKARAEYMERGDES